MEPEPWLLMDIHVPKQLETAHDYNDFRLEPSVV